MVVLGAGDVGEGGGDSPTLELLSEGLDLVVDGEEVGLFDFVLADELALDELGVEEELDLGVVGVGF